MSAADLKAAAERAVALALESGATASEAFCQDQREVEVRVFDRAVESLTEASAKGVGIRAIASEGRSGYAYGTTFDDAGLAEIAARAVEIAQASDPDEYAGLPRECGSAATGALVSAQFDEWDTARKVALAIAVDDAARTTDERVSQVEQTIYSDVRGRVAIANSEGFSDGYESSGAYAYSSAFAGEGDDLMTGLGLGIGRGPEELDAFA
ncbi:MAG: DNA gyrase modulator, partial [Solirubrobacterales bacterium]